MILTSRTCVAAGMVLVSPQNEAGGAPEPSPPAVFTVQVKVADPVAPVVSLAIAVTLEVPAAVGVPESRPDVALMESPAGRPGALDVRVWPGAESAALIAALAALPTVEAWLPGLVTVTALPPPPPVVWMLNSHSE